MFKNILLAMFFALVATNSLAALADNDELQPVNVSALTIAHNDAEILQVTDQISKKTENVTAQSQVDSVERSESVLSTKWLFVVALFWFVILSNRRGV